VNLGRTFENSSYKPADGVSEIEKGYIYDLYDSEILYVDFEVGRFLTYLKEKDQFEDSLIIISADHGESLVEDDMYCQHGTNLYWENTEIPLIMHLPKTRGGLVVDTPASTIDIAPTILEQAGIPISADIRGTPFTEFIDNGQEDREIVLMTGWWDGPSLRLRKMGKRNPDFAIVADGHKYITHSIDAYMAIYPLEFIHLWRNSLIGHLKGDELYNLSIDPEEENNIRKHHLQFAESLRRKLYKSREFISYIALRKGKLKDKIKDKLTEEQINVLKSLGYL